MGVPFAVDRLRRQGVHVRVSRWMARMLTLGDKECKARLIDAHSQDIGRELRTNLTSHALQHGTVKLSQLCIAPCAAESTLVLLRL